MAETNCVKDPLQEGQVPYEILGVPLSASLEVIESACKNLLAASPANAGEIQIARNKLCQPRERALIDALLYQPAFLEKLVPNVLSDSALLISGRQQVISSWMELGKVAFPHYGFFHSSAVLWHHWALYREREALSARTRTPFPKVEKVPEAFSLDELWKNSLSSWVFLVHSDDFWSEWQTARNFLGLTCDAPAIAALKGDLEKYFFLLLASLREKYRKADDLESFLRLSGYEFLLGNEIEMARQLNELGLTLNRKTSEGEMKRFKVACGKVMLEKIGLFDTISQLLKKKALEQPENERLEKLSSRLSPFMKVELLLKNEEFDKALQEISGLPEPQQKSDEGIEITTRIHLQKGKKHLHLNHFDVAFNSWELAAKDGKQAANIRKMVFESCKEKAVAIQTSAPEKAILLIEKTMRMTGDQSLKIILSVIYVEKGIDSIARGKKENNNLLIEKGIFDLQKAIEIDPNNAKAIEYLKSFEDLSFETTHRDIAELIQNSRWEQAIGKMEALLKSEETQGSPVVAKRLAFVYFQYGMEKVNKGHLNAIEFIQRGTIDIRKAVALDPGNVAYKEQLLKLEEILFKTKNADIVNDLNAQRFEIGFKKLKGLLEREPHNQIVGNMLENCCFQWILAEAGSGTSNFSAFEVEKFLKLPIELLPKYKMKSGEEIEKLLAAKLNAIAPELLKLGIGTLSRDAKSATKILMASAGVLKSAYQKDLTSEEIKVTRERFAARLKEANLARMIVFLG